MFFLLSGEGVTDMGAGSSAATICEGEDYLVGPMAVIVAKIVEAKHDYSILDGACGFISEDKVAQQAKKIRRTKLPRKHQDKETAYFFKTAQALAYLAQSKSKELKDDVVAVLFRDADGTASAERGEWDDKRKSMLDGFDEEGFDKGVPMIPKPKSEAWLICAWKKHPYRGCEALEERSGNDNSPNNLKDELEELLDEEVTPDSLREKVGESFDIDRIKMPSFKAFRERLEEVIA